MPELTVAEAARRLGVKPNKVRALVAARKLSATNAVPEPGRRGRARLLLDADEVDRLAHERARKKAARAAHAATTALDAAAGGEQVAESPDTLLVGEIATAHASDPSGQRTVALVQSMLAPLVAELHDARETIRRQAEELGMLRAAVARLEDDTPLPSARTRTMASGDATRRIVADVEAEEVVAPSPASHADGLAPMERSAEQSMRDPSPSRRGSVPLWRRAALHLRQR